MQIDEKLRWLETRIASSLRPKQDDLKNMFSREQNRITFHEFMCNEDVRKLYIWVGQERNLVASLRAPTQLKTKSIFFVKANPGVKLTKDNIGQEVYYMDYSDSLLEHMGSLTREIYMPMLCIDSPATSTLPQGVSQDRVMDVLHRVAATVETTEGHVKGEIILPLPSVEVLADAADQENRRVAVLHVLESTVIGWIKQIKGVLRHDPISELDRRFGKHPGPLDELALWNTRLEKLKSINQQLDLQVSQDILTNLEQANSQYAQSFSNVRREIYKAVDDTREILCFLSTMLPWFEQLHQATDPDQCVRLFPPLVHTLKLVWMTSRYYHQKRNFHHLLRIISNEVVYRAHTYVGEDVLKEPLESYTKLREALKICASFRGTYLDERDDADGINQANLQADQDNSTSQVEGPMWHVKMYGPFAYILPSSLPKTRGSEVPGRREDTCFTDSPWPPRNANCFTYLNSFMERCNDVLELVQTTRHFAILAHTAEVGGAGAVSLDALVREIHHNYTLATDEFFSHVHDVLKLDAGQSFEKAFFTFRTVVKELERRLAGVLRTSFQQCPSIGAQLRLLEVFEGVSSRELVQAHLKDKDSLLLRSMTDEVYNVRKLFQDNKDNPPQHRNMPPLVSRLYWIYSLKQRIRIPMEKLRRVSPASLEGDVGWQLRDSYSDAILELERYETSSIAEWEAAIESELTVRLKQPLLVVDEYSSTEEDGSPVPSLIRVNLDPHLVLLLREFSLVRVNLDPHLVLLLREFRYLTEEPFLVKLPRAAREIVRNTSCYDLQVMAARLEMIVSKYNRVMRHLTDVERPLFGRKLAKIDTLFEEGMTAYTWMTEESVDFIEVATSLVCLDVHRNLDIIQTNCLSVVDMTRTWCGYQLDVFSGRDTSRTYSITDLERLTSDLEERLQSVVVPMGLKIHALVEDSYQAADLSEASPAWEQYLDFVDTIVLDGLKHCAMSSLSSMLNNLLESNSESSSVPILTIRLELINDSVAFRPPLDSQENKTSVQETANNWLSRFIGRGDYCTTLNGTGTYRVYIEEDLQVQSLVEQITELVQDNAQECLKYIDLFTDYHFLWEQDVNQTFADFLQGHLSQNPLRQASEANQLRRLASVKSAASRTSSNKSSIESAGLVGTAERAFLTPKDYSGDPEDVPSLDEFDCEIHIYKVVKDELSELQEYEDVGWLRVDLTPIKQTLTMYAEKWMWTYTQYLTNQVTDLLVSLDEFLVRIEPEIESITGKEKDTASFMRMMRLFNEVAVKQSEMEGKFAAMHRTVLLLEKYGQNLPDRTRDLFEAAPARWNSLKTKVSLAKQRLGPRIQEESAVITKDLRVFGDRLESLYRDLSESNVYSRDCEPDAAWTLIDQLSARLASVEAEAQDLFQLQELLEVSIVNFALLPQCRNELDDLRVVWLSTENIYQQHAEWKEQRWQKLSTKYLREETDKQLVEVMSLPERVRIWDVYVGLKEAILHIQTHLPLIDDLCDPAMRIRHWKQLVRATGSQLQVDNDAIKRLTLGELFDMGLQSHVEDVRAIIQRAVKDLSIENSLKFYEEVWLSKIFDMRPHSTRTTEQQAGEKVDVYVPQEGEGTTSDSGSATKDPADKKSGTGRATSRASFSTYSRLRPQSVTSLPGSLLNLTEDDTESISLIGNAESIFHELEDHQVSLQTMQTGSAAGSFLDEVVKWQKRLQTIESTLTVWLSVQERWVELEDIFSVGDTKTALSHDAHRFSVVNKDFRLLMKATERNPNVLICCSRKNLLSILERQKYQLDHCYKSLLTHLERRRQHLPRFYFLSMEDVLHIVCNGHHLPQANLYIHKLLENVRELVYHTEAGEDKTRFLINGVQSFLGEKLVFTEPVECSGQVETWLPGVIQMIRTSLQSELAAAVTLQPSKPGSRGQERSGSREEEPAKPSSRSSSRPGTRKSVGTAASGEKLEPDQTAEDRDSFSWILDHTTETVTLATQVQLTSNMNECVQQFKDGDKEAIKSVLAKLDEMVKAAVIMLRGCENEDKPYKREQTTESQRLPDGVEKESSVSEPPGTRTARTTSNRGSQLEPAGSVLDPPQQGSTARQGSTLEPPGGDTRASQASPGPEQSEAPEEPPVDTMNLSLAMPELTSITKSKETPVQPVEPRQEYQLVLLPSQIHKITSLIALLAYKREMLQRALDQLESEKDPTEDFSWSSQLHYSFDKETNDVTVKVLDMDVKYGFEYQGSADPHVLSCSSERTLASLLSAVTNHRAGLCTGPATTGSLEVVQILARALGQPLYTVNCSLGMDAFMMQDLFKGLLITGSWLCLQNLHCVGAPVVDLFSQLLATTLDALKTAKPSVTLLTEEAQLGPAGACFLVQDNSMPLTAHHPDRVMMLDSAATKLPPSVLAQTRVVSVNQPDVTLLVQILLSSQGFVHARSLARQLVVLKDLTTNVIHTNMPVTQNSKRGHGCSDLGWSVKNLKQVCSEAGTVLDALYQKRLNTKTEQEEKEEDGEEPDSEKEEEEEEALVTALRNTFVPRLQAGAGSLFMTLVADIWPRTQVPKTFDEQLTKSAVKGSQRAGSLVLTTPVVPLPQRHGDVISRPTTAPDDVTMGIDDAIAVAVSELGLMPGVSFQAKVAQLAQLNAVHRTIVVVGPAGCGKSEMIKTFAVAERTRGKEISVQSVFARALEPGRLFGRMDPETKEWQSGLVPSLLKKSCLDHPHQDLNRSVNILQMDGMTSAADLDVLESVLLSNSTIILPNNERLSTSPALRFIWELDSVSDLSPALLANVGVVCMTYQDVGWQLILARWLDTRHDKDFLKTLCQRYVYPTLEYLCECTRLPVQGGAPPPLPQYTRIVQQSEDNIINTLTALFEAVSGPFTDLSKDEMERCLAFSVVWSMAGTLHNTNWDSFSTWFSAKFPVFPPGGLVYDYVLDADSREFVKWSDLVSPYAGHINQGFNIDSFVHTVTTERVSYLVGLLSDVERPVMILGERGCGKTSIVADRLKTVCSGEVAEYLGLTINTNRFTTASQIYTRLDERLEWRHGSTYVPRGNKRLICFIDDINMAQVDESGTQTAVELVREHIDDQGFYSPGAHQWRYISNVSYITTVNPAPTASVPRLSGRLTRHFALLPCSYPDNQELRTIYQSLLLGHFISADTSFSQDRSDRGELEQLRTALTTLVQTSIELQDRLRQMYLPIAQRVHYVFNMKTLRTIFSNMTLSVGSRCSVPEILSLWRTECAWAYRQRMGDDVDRERYDLVFTRAVKKHFSLDEHIELLTSPDLPVFSSIRQQDSGIIRVAGLRKTGRSGTSAQDSASPGVDGYELIERHDQLRSLLEEAVDEYNKVNPQIRLRMYQSTMSFICRLSRTISSNHVDGQSIIISDGSPGHASLIIRLAAHISGFKIFRIHPSPLAATEVYKLDHFKMDLANAFRRAGVKGEKLLFLLHEEELLNDDFLVFVQDFIIATNTITNLFTFEEQTTIINSIRTEVTLAGLTYTREVAWDFFLRTVSSNFRVCIVESQGGSVFQRHCREFPALTQNVNFVWMEHWNKRQLIHNADHILREIPWMSDLERENMSHLLASMHLVIRQQDPTSLSLTPNLVTQAGDYNHLTNTTYQMFVERYVSLSTSRHSEVERTQTMARSALAQIQRESKMAERLHNQLQHEKIVLDEKRTGTVNMLAQIGQDTAITEQQVKIVKQQQEKIKKLKKMLPEYQVAHQRAVYKTTNIATDTRRLVQGLNPENLEKLRAMQKPPIDIEDVMAAVIIILKSPSSDLTWQKGAKRQLSNLERFVEELESFDNLHMPETTLQLVEAYLKKASFDPETLERRSGNPVLRSLAKWVQGVAKYHRMMLSRVKPLHAKEEEMMQQVTVAEHKMASLDNKRRCLEERLADLAKGFEEATVDKNDEEEKTVKMSAMLKTSARLRKVIRTEHRKYQQIYASREERVASIPGSVAVAAAFLSYLGPYHYSFRRCMLTIHWPRCLLERGVPLIFDCVTNQGREVDWSLDLGAVVTARRVQLTLDGDDVITYSDVTTVGDDVAEEQAESQKLAEDASEKEKDQTEEKERASPVPEDDPEQSEHEKATSQPGTPAKEATPEKREATPREKEGSPKQHEDNALRKSEEGTPRRSAEGTPRPQSPVPGLEVDGSEYAESDGTEATIPAVSQEEYQSYVMALVKLLVGQQCMVRWSRADLGLRHMENAAMILSSWQRPPFLIDPSGDGVKWLKWINRSLGNNDPSVLDMETSMVPTHVYNESPTIWRSDPQVLLTIEKCVLRGEIRRGNAKKLASVSFAANFASKASYKHGIFKKKPPEDGQVVLMENCRETIDNDVMPLVYHHNFMGEHPDPTAEPKMIRFCDRRILCHNRFRVYLTTRKAKPRFSPEMASMTQLVNYGLAAETLTEEMMNRAFARLHPDLYLEKRKALNAREQLKAIMDKVMAFVRLQIYKTADGNVLWNEENVSLIADTFSKKDECLSRYESTERAVSDLDSVRSALLPLARRAATLYAVTRSLESLRQEYHFPLPYFTQLLDQAVGGQLPEGFMDLESPASAPGSRGTGGAGAGAAGARSDSADSQKPQEQETQPDNKDNAGESETEDNASDGEESTFIQAIVDARDHESRMRVIEQIRGVRGSDNFSRDVKVDASMLQEAESEYLSCGEADTVETVPTEGLEYEPLPEERITELVNNFTSLLYNSVNMSLYEEDRLLFSTLLCLYVTNNTDDDVTAAEISLLTQGTPGLNLSLTLADFNCKSSVPSWLPADVWDEVMAVSVMPGTLSNLCVHVAENAEAWETWYRAERPEDEQIPAIDSREGDAEDEERAARADLQHLIVLRLLRPDRLPSAMTKYVSRHLAVTSQAPPTVYDVIRSTSNQYYGVLVLLPPSGEHLMSSMKVRQSAGDQIRALGKSAGVSVETVKLSGHQPAPVDRVLEQVEKEDGWLLVEDVHLSSPTLVQEFVYHLTRTCAARDSLEEDKRRASQFCVWMTVQPGSELPQHILQHFHKICWDQIGDELITGVSEEEESPQKLVHYNNVDNMLPQVIVSVMRSLPDHVTDHVSPEHVPHVFGACVIQATCLVRQHVGTRGMATWTSLDWCLGEVIRILTEKVTQGDVNVQQVASEIAQNVYGTVLSQESDREYVTSLVHDVMQAVIQSQSSVPVGAAKIPVPEGSDVKSAATSFEEKCGENSFSTLAALNLSPVEKDWMTASSQQFIRRLELLVETSKMDSGEIAQDPFAELDMYRLRQSLTLCTENLPPFLELGDVSKIGYGEKDSTFPYHCPSVLSFSTASTTLLPESIGHVLLQECLWYNRLLCHVRQCVHEVRLSLVSGPDSIRGPLAAVARALQQEHVPLSWIHANKQPTGHTLLTWLDDMERSYGQLYGWVKQGLVTSLMTSDSPRGHLPSLWLGGLVNPQAVLAAFRHEKAVLSNCSVSEISFRVEMPSNRGGSLDDVRDDVTVYVHGMYLQGAAWDTDNKQIVSDSVDVHALPDLVIRAVKTDGDDVIDSYNCPVFMNKSRQTCVCHLPLKRGEEEKTFIQSGTAIILDPGVSDGSVRYSKRQNKPPALMFSPRLVDYELDSPAQDPKSDLGDSSLTVSKQYSSQPSQLSYAEFTPKASPLPPTLQLTRGDRLSPSQKKAEEDEMESQRSDDIDSARTGDETGRTQPTDRTQKTTDRSDSTPDSERRRRPSQESRTSSTSKSSKTSKQSKQSKNSNQNASEDSMSSPREPEMVKKMPSRISERDEGTESEDEESTHSAPNSAHSKPNSAHSQDESTHSRPGSKASAASDKSHKSETSQKSDRSQKSDKSEKSPRSDKSDDEVSDDERRKKGKSDDE